MSTYKLNEQFILRTPAMEDAKQLFQVKNNPDAAAVLEAPSRLYSMADINHWIQFHLENPANLMLLIVDNASNLVIGHAALYNMDPTMQNADFGILIGRPEYWNRGVGRLATKKMLELAKELFQISTIRLHVLASNSRAIHLYASIGFQITGKLPDPVMKNGETVNIITMEFNHGG